MSINVKTLKKIKQYGRLRFANNPNYSERVLIRVYERAGGSQRRFFDKEMNTYLQAIKHRKIVAGDSILASLFSEVKKSSAEGLETVAHEQVETVPTSTNSL